MMRLRAPTRYTQRILEDLCDDRGTVEAILIAKNKLPASP